MECLLANFILKLGTIIRYGMHPKWIRIESHEMRTLCLDRLKLLDANLNCVYLVLAPTVRGFGGVFI